MMNSAVVNSFRFGSVLFTTCIFTLPLIGQVPLAWLWPVFSVQRMIDMISGASCGGAGKHARNNTHYNFTGDILSERLLVTAGQLLIINSARVGEQGRVQGVAGGLASMMMAIFPAIAGWIWSYTFANLPYPFHPHIPYCFVGSLGLMMVYVSCILPKALERPQNEREEENPSLSGPASRR